MALGTLYAVPIIEHGPDTPYFDGILFCILLAAFLWLERVPSEQISIAATCVVAAAVLGGIVVPRLDSTRPWFNYEAFAEKLEPKKAEVFSWSHSYGPLTWPRDGREMLRIKAGVPAYWKATNLDEFDGVRWREAPPSRDALAEARLNRRWIQTIKVVDRGLRSTDSVGAGNVQAILPGSSRLALPQSDGTFVTSSKPLRPGDSYQALVYVPRPSEAQLKRSGTKYPGYTQDFLELRVPLQGGSIGKRDLGTGRPLGPNAQIRFAPYGTQGGAGVVWPSGIGIEQDGEGVLADSPYAQLYSLTQEIRRTTKTPYEFVQAVQDRVQAGTTYDERPPQRRYPLAAFLFDTKTGYCQQFSGVMALMLRMGGIPARVASGFSPGSYNSERKDYVVRDTDAHSWVEAYFAPYGWITFDPTPAASPASSQLDDRGTSANGGPPCRRSSVAAWASPATARSHPAIPAPTSRPPIGAAAGSCRSAAGSWPWRCSAASPCGAGGRRSRRSARAGRAAARAAPLGARPDARRDARAPRGAARRLGGGRRLRAGDARPALRARTAQPTRAQRRALRRQLGYGLGLRGALRAWWALPPLPRGALKDRLRRPYTQK